MSQTPLVSQTPSPTPSAIHGALLQPRALRSLDERFPDTKFKVLVQGLPNQEPSPTRYQKSGIIADAFNVQGSRLLQTWEHSVQSYYINPSDVSEIDLLVVYITNKQKPHFDIIIDKMWFSERASDKLLPEDDRTSGLVQLIDSGPKHATYSPKVRSGNEVEEVMIRAAIHDHAGIVYLLPWQASELEQKIDALIITNSYPHYHVKSIWLQEPRADLLTSAHDTLKNTIAAKVTNRTHSIM